MILNGKPAVVEYEPDTDLRDTEQVPLLHPGGIEAFLQEEVLPYTFGRLVQPRGREDRDTRSTSTGTSTSPGRCGPWRRLRPTSSSLEQETEGLLAEEFSVKTRNDHCDPRTSPCQ